VGRIEAKQQFCPPGLTIEMIRDRWSLLILRECFFGARTRDRLLAAFSIAPSLLGEKLDGLLASGLLCNISHTEFVLTRRGLDFNLAAGSAMQLPCEQSVSPFDGITTCPDCSEVLATEMKGLGGKYRHRPAKAPTSTYRVDTPIAQMKPSDRHYGVQIDVDENN
jgi:DNA-binding HxlR family transcriptional regulator